MTTNRLCLRRRATIAVGTALLGVILAVSSVAAQTTRSGGLNSLIISGGTRCYTSQNTFTLERYKQIIVESPVIRSTVLPARFQHAYWTVKLVGINPDGTAFPLSTRSTYGSWQFTGAGHQYTFINRLSPLTIRASWRGGVLMQETIQLTNAAGTPVQGGTTTVWEDEYFTDSYSYSPATGFTSEAGHCVFR
jgi:hypothetical protein